MTTLHDRLKQLRNKKNLTQKDLAKELNITKAAISNYERGRRKPEYETLKKISDFFGVDIDYLYGQTTQSNRKESVRIPILGSVIAGTPVEAIQDILGYVEIDSSLAQTGEYFALKIKGESMEPRFLEGDTIIVRKQQNVESGEIAVVIINGNEATVKIVQKRTDGIELIATNSLVYSPTFYSKQDIEELSIEIMGKVVELRAKI
ncbi:helix-turn-helix domain-containing protein [Peptostreptococcaceae bacterium OttesenSCG-928-C18]|nr:helix-turn-helix domain-containing protein [Peptostreptococcaceae bacterium OttesenSCG-928-C18]